MYRKVSDDRGGQVREHGNEDAVHGDDDREGDGGATLFCAGEAEREAAGACCYQAVEIPSSGKETKAVREKLLKMVSVTEEDSFVDGGYVLVCLVDPGQFRPINELLQAECKGQAELSVISLSDSVEDDSAFV
ncbi:Ribosome maturation protein SBDS [Smittium culicis]|uniref:Ribosome maturation protein SBDS n=1 Tax=Smittium culicis TaxID=133412 RepID=A0A1R1XQ49_9FUNG|nr:Ribosome maturation protein SBDS [Smittium culicis]